MMESKYHHHTNFFKRMLSRMRRQPRGQSFVELMFVIMFLALLLTGVVEYGFMLNFYLHVLDGSREAARYSSTWNPFVLDSSGVTISSYYYPPFYYVAAAEAATTMAPVSLNPANPDDIVVSVFSLDGATPTRFPTTDPNGWSLCAHFKANAEDTAAGYAGFAAYFPSLNPPAPVPIQPVAAWNAGCIVRTTQISATNLKNLLGSLVPPDTGVVLVEIYYNYPQLLKLPVLTSVLPDPIPLYVYSIMPLSSAQPTQVP